MKVKKGNTCAYYDVHRNEWLTEFAKKCALNIDEAMEMEEFKYGANGHLWARYKGRWGMLK